MRKPLGESDYRRGGLERIREAELLLRAEFFAGSIYLAGRAAEGMLRAVIWVHDTDVRMGRQSLETGHDLRRMLGWVENLGLLGEREQREPFSAAVQQISRLWSNNMRFMPTERIEADWRRLGMVHNKRTLKQAAQAYYIACSAVVKRSEVLCEL